MRQILTLSFLAFVFTSFAQDGTLDLTYGDHGRQIPTIATQASNFKQRVSVLSDGKILQSFTAGTSNTDFGLVKYLSNGSPDPSFGTNGVVTTDFGGNEIATDLVVRPSDGKIVVVGYKYVAGGDDVFAIARYNTNGTLDATFGTGGKLTTAIGTDAMANTVLQASNITVVAGTSFNSSTGRYEFTLVRYLNNGALDVSFSGDGIQTTSIGLSDVINAVAVQTDGKVVAAGYSFNGFTYSFALARYNTNGSLDNGFDFDGVLTKAIGNNGNDQANAIAFDPGTLKIVAGGLSYNGVDNDFAILRLNANGSADNSFDGDGIVTTNFGGNNDVANAIDLATGGKILAAGSTNTDFSPNSDFVIARYNNNGSLDNSFNTFGPRPGANIIDFGSDDYGYDIAPQGNFVIFGGIVGNSLGTARINNFSPVLPLQLLDFTASKQSNSVQLNWQTTGEENTLGYDVLRSSDGTSFTRIGTVKAAGSSNSTKDYSFVDASPLKDINFYRLQIINTDRTASYSKIVSVKWESKNQLLAFPNPVHTVLHVQLTVPAGPISIQLFDLSGRMLKSQSLSSTGSSLSVSIDMSDLPEGTYLVKAGEGVIKVVKGN